jgi:hypothetical protein
MVSRNFSIQALLGNIGGFWQKHKSHLILFVVILASVVGLIWTNSYKGDSLIFSVIRDILMAILISASAGIIFEALIRSKAEEMLRKAVAAEEDRRKEEIGNMIEEAVTKYSGLYSSGLADFHDSRDYFHKSLSNLPANVRKIRILAVHGMRIWKNAGFVNRLNSSASAYIQVLLLDPNCREVLASRADESPADLSVESIKADIDAALRHVCHLGVRCPNLQVKFYRRLPSFSMVLLDDMMYLTGYLKGLNSQNSPSCRLERRQSPGLYELFDDYFSRLWDESSLVDLGVYQDR